MDIKKLKLDKKIITIRGDQAIEMYENKIVELDIRECLMSLLPNAEIKSDSKKSITMWDLSIKIKNHEGAEIELSDEDFGFIKKVVSENFRMRTPDNNIIPYYPPFVIAQILKELKSKEK
ncbi:hypothetical protein KAU51_04250 [Candidatus Parcubacteria bacterium]|nr:hypothetical protein [Candidatus Parcubacteria bacterium]